MNRIIVIGVSSSGKTTLAFNLAARLGYPCTDLDDLFWRPGWQHAPLDEFRTSAAKAAAPEKWVLAGNYDRARDILWNRADTLVWVDPGFATALWRLIARTTARLIDGKPVCNGNRETLRNVFSRNSLLPWFLKTYRQKTGDYDAIFNDPAAWPHLKKIRLTNRAEIDTFLKSIEAAAAISPSAPPAPAALPH